MAPRGGGTRIVTNTYKQFHIKSRNIRISKQPGLEVIKLLSCSTEYEIYPAHKCSNANYCWRFNILSRLGTTYVNYRSSSIFAFLYLKFYEIIKFSWVEHATVHNLLALLRYQKVKCHLISITKSISKIFVPIFVCILTNEIYKTYQTGFSFCPLDHTLGVGFWGAGVPRGCPGGQFRFQTWSCGISNRREWQAEQNASKIFTPGSNWWARGEVKWSNIITFWLPCKF